MEFFSLFDPADSIQNKPRKQRIKTDQPLEGNQKKPNQSGRRKNRKNHIKNETLPEESSFLNDPDLSTELLVKDISYIDSFIAVNQNICQDKNDCNKNIKRRNSGRKIRRRKNKVSPAKDLYPCPSWEEKDVDVSSRRSSEEKFQNWNNRRNARSKVLDDLGKNVNDLNIDSVEYTRKSRRKTEPFDVKWRSIREPTATEPNDLPIYDTMEKLEKVNLKDDYYLAGDMNLEDLQNDVFYSSDDLDESVDDSSSELEDESSGEIYGSLPPEPRFGNVEYKLQLVNPSERRFQHLVTQLKWRLRSGGGAAVYVVGVRDCGALRGLRAKALRASLHTLRRMAGALRATLRHVTARRVAPHRAVAEVYVRKLADTQSIELRVAVMGANDAGKSTLIGVLTQGELDNGRGSARLNMFRHLHEVRSGRTSSLSHEILGFDSQGNVVNYGCSELMTAERIGERSAKLVSFLDLAGHRKYQKTTVHGLTGYSPHYAMLVVSSTAGLNQMTEEHISLLLALDLRFFIVVTKTDLVPNNMDHLLRRLEEILKAGDCKRRPLLITNEHLARTCVGPQPSILDTLDTSESIETQTSNDDETETVPVFPVSCVKGAGLSALHCYLLALDPLPCDLQPTAEEESCEFQIDEIFHVGESAGPVVGGLLARGHLNEGDNLLIGPLDTGEFVEITVKSIYRNRVPCGRVKAGQSASLGLSKYPPNLRQGMVLIAIPEDYKNRSEKSRFSIEKCPKCKNSENYCQKCDETCQKAREMTEFTEFVKSAQNSPKNGRRKNDSINGKNERINLKNEATNVKNDRIKRRNDSMSNTKDTSLHINESINVKNDKVNVKNEVMNRKNDQINVKNDSVNVNNDQIKIDNVLQDVESCLAKTINKNIDENLYSGSDTDEKRSKRSRRSKSRQKRKLVEKLPVSDQNVSINSKYSEVTAKSLINTINSASISNNSAGISNNSASISNNSASICNHSSSISNNSSSISNNSASISNNSASISKISSSISNNSASITGLATNPKAPISRRNSDEINGNSEAVIANSENVNQKTVNVMQDKEKTSSVTGNPAPSTGNSSSPTGNSSSSTGNSSLATGSCKDRNCNCYEGILLEDPNDPRGCLFFQATVRLLRHSTAIYPGFQATVHIGNIRQTAVIEGIMSWNSVLRAGESASVVFRFVRQPEYVRTGRKMLFRDGFETRGVGRIQQVFPYNGK